MKLDTKEKVDQFESMLGQYLRKKGDHPLPYIPLARVFEISQERESFRLFYAALDLKINLCYLGLDLKDYCKGPSRGLEELKGMTPLDNEVAFEIRADVHRALSVYIFRYRAIWDKIFGFCILLLAPERYSEFRDKKKGRKKKFLEIMKAVPVSNPDELSRVLDDLNVFEERFRTPEAHDTGSLRKWTFIVGDFFTPESMDLIFYWNMLIRTLDSITKAYLSNNGLETTP
jgi:hypothetical protein